ncbi:hypothetical protein ACJRO7_011020 [Eucalyptus globulus]|uniref:Uncharacterized protein n=1 Tax=Eucalyptus globulus TaxID=34317 RepID=A0ABD3LH75_EUCGL
MAFAENSQRQRSAQVHDFKRNQYRSRFPPAVLENGITKRTWETIVRHASPCVINDDKMYFCQALDKASIVFNSVMKVAQAALDGQIYQSVDIVAHSQKFSVPISLLAHPPFCTSMVAETEMHHYSDRPEVTPEFSYILVSASCSYNVTEIRQLGCLGPESYHCKNL